MLVDLNLKGRKTLVIISDELEAKKRARQALEAGSIVRIFRSKSSDEIKKSGAEIFLEDLKNSINDFHPYLTMISTGNHTLDRKIARLARENGSLVYVVDSPGLNDLNMPAVAKLGDIRIAISTGGKSPAMASILRKRIEKNIRMEDILQVRLQGEIRRRIKKSNLDKSARKKLIYALINDKRIKKLLKEENYGVALSLALKKIPKGR